MSKARIDAVTSVLGFLTGFFICAYSMTVNDVYDADVDKVNQPERPIPSGRVSVETANRLALLVLASGVAASVLSLNVSAVAVALVYAFLSWLYNSWAKKKGIAGNLIVASSLAIPFIYGGIIGGGSITSSLLLLMALTAFFAGVGREVVKAMADVAGDAKRNVDSVARSAGMNAAAAVGGGFFLLAVFTSWVPLILGMANWLYTYGVVFPDFIFAYLTFSILRARNAENARLVKNVALLGMLIGLVVFIGGGL